MNLIQAMMSLVLVSAGHTPATTEGDVDPFFVPEVENTQEGIILNVESHGCTKKQDFRVRVGHNESLIVERLRKDRCRETPQLIELRYSHEELGLSKPPVREQRIAGK
ncbi:MAG: hypothetical protein A2286_02765 [Gammaproteobacteria bacterium RIFOXYA12_FULL_61_12]|nr:MAG: hypothetical protein A2514_02550 [Gammaproteobacteria bacterium RIFOXYD12_FULL_61_37]OGT93912.1 MAG: hypothetical protein A2286_02765 [Gammaproteobacteria bacterium RIFOXYA12_FULL_61_12]